MPCLLSNNVLPVCTVREQINRLKYGQREATND